MTRSLDPEFAPDGSAGPMASPPLEPGLYVVATPIGNLRDITLRALDVLRGADVVFAEDTRQARKLFAAHGVSTRLEAYHEHNAEQARPKALAALEAGRRVALISDAGTPLVSDPGYKLVRAVAEAGHRVTPIPGASALLAGLVVAALPTDRFLFAGFLPPKAGARRAALAELGAVPATLVFYESGPRLAESLADMASVLGSRSAAVARELTKLFEEVRRAPLSELAAHYAQAGAPKGEIVVLVGPPPEPAPADEAAIDAALAEALARLSPSAAAAEVAERLGAPKRVVYQRAMALKRD